ncbi:MAG: hypothetical protein AAF349_07000 [Cyanobacteria bacterium P01_A01_bin.68]
MPSRHTLDENTNSLAKLDYAPLLDIILELVQENRIFMFSADKRRLRISVYDIAYAIATKEKLQPQNPLTQNFNIKAATVNLTSDTEFYSKIQVIRDELKKQLDNACGQNETKACLENLCTPLSQFTDSQPDLPFKYPFNRAYKFTSQRLIIENSFVPERRKGNESAIKAHHLNVRFEGLSQFENKLFDSLESYINKIAASDFDDWDELTELLEEKSEGEKSELTEIKRIVDTESLPRLLRDIKIDYLDYLKKECAKTNVGYSNTEGFECLETLINRLRLLIDYIKNPDLDDSYFKVNYSLNEPVNLRTAFSQANAFDKLPIIPEYEGLIGESVDKEKGIKEFNLGIRLKLNGSVNSYHENSVLEYFSNEINPDSQRHQEQLQDAVKAKFFKEKILTTACLYYFIFAVDESGNIDEKNYNPIPKFESDILNKLKPGTSDDEVKEVLRNIKQLLSNGSIWRVSQKLAALKTLLKTLLEKKDVLPSFSKSAQLCINKGILNKTSIKIINNRSFFRIDLNSENQSQAKANTREALGYIEVKSPTVDPQSLASLSVTFSFEDVRYFPDGDKQQFEMKHDISSIKGLPVVFSPIAEEPIEGKDENGEPIIRYKLNLHPIYDKHFRKEKIISIDYKSKRVREEIFQNSQSPEARIYRQVFTLLTYLCISVCREAISLDKNSIDEKLFILIFRFHLKDEQESTEDEIFLNSLSKSLAHILRRDCLADAQGLNIKNIQDSSFKFRVQQALSSLYSLVPKTFEFKGGYQPQLDKLAIIVVSSWLSDAVWNEKDKADRISNIYGEIIAINKISANSVKVEPVKTFADNQAHSKIYKEPEIIKDEISKLYQQGYRHFLYIAKAPYSRSLGITKLESEPDSLFFMSQDVIRYLKEDKTDIKLYPIFMDTYPAINLTQGTVDSFYIPDIDELAKLSEDKNQQTRVFLNLFTGRSVDQRRTIFNNVVCYSTLLNVYDVKDTKNILNGLLDKNSPLQQTILQYITLFHYSRYEMNRNIAFKLNPYSKLIGEDGIGTVSTYSYSNRNVKFNNLAYLTEIRSALYGK